MASTAGICTTTIKCRTARSGRIIAVPLGEAFVCPDCGNGLSAPAQFTPMPEASRMPQALPMALLGAGAGACLLGGALFLGHQLAGGGASRTADMAAIAAAPRPAPLRPAPDVQPVPDVQPARDVQPAPVVQLAGVAPAAPPPQSVPASPAPVKQAPPQPAIAQVAAPQPTPVQAIPAQVAATPAPMPQVPAPIAKAPNPAAAQLAFLSPMPAPQLLHGAPNAQPAGMMAVTLPPSLSSPVPPADQPFSPAPLAGGAPAYPAEMAADGRPGRISATCQIQIDGAPTACRATARSGGPAFATAALAWLNHGHVRFRPIILRGRTLAAVRTWVITMEEPPAALAEARRKAALAAPPPAAVAAAPQIASAQVTASPLPPPIPLQPVPIQQAAARIVVPAVPPASALHESTFSTHVISGGIPPFPIAYDENRPGAVTVSCTIDTRGKPNGCSVVRQAGGSLFANSVQSWLHSGKVRFKPVTVNGQPVARQETWTVVFNQVPTDQE